MNKNVRLMIFIILLGMITSGLLVGSYELTKDRIALNADIKLKSAILDGFDISYTTANIHDVFNQEIQVIEYKNDARGNITYYVDQNTHGISFEFSGGGVWDTISGVITLESDLITIKQIAVLEQAETPGLGGVVATSQYLDTFIGVKMTPQLEINKDDSNNKDNEVDTITGATRTSKAFEAMLNETYSYAMAIWSEENYGGDMS